MTRNAIRLPNKPFKWLVFQSYTCMPYSADSCLLSHNDIGIILLMLPLTYKGLASIKRLILLLYIWLDVAVRPLEYVNTLWLWL